MRCAAPLALCLLLAALAAAPARAADVEIRSVHILSQVGDALPTDESKVVEKEDRVTLHAALEAVVDGRAVWFCNAERFVLGGVIREADRTLRWNRRAHGIVHLRWYKVEWDKRLKRYYSNTEPRWHWDRIDYAQTLFARSNHRAMSQRATVAATLTEDRPEVGTMRYQLEVDFQGRTHRTPGAESRWRGGLAADVHRISRKGATGIALLDWAQAFYNLPYIWGSAGPSDDEHQSERFIGADCADFCVAAARHAGLGRIPYGSTKTMKRSADTLCRVRLDPASRRFVRPDGSPVRIGGDVRPGDLIFGNRHVGFLTADRGERGILDEHDTVTHTFFAEPLERPLSAVRIFAQNFEVLRFRPEAPAGRALPAVAKNAKGRGGARPALGKDRPRRDEVCDAAQADLVRESVFRRDAPRKAKPNAKSAGRVERRRTAPKQRAGIDPPAAADETRLIERPAPRFERNHRRGFAFAADPDEA